MNKEKLLDSYNQEYTQECPSCSKALTIISQKDHNPEYYTSVYVKCECGEWVEFVVAVN